MRDDIVSQIRAHIEVMERVGNVLTDTVASAALEMADALAAGNKVLVCGNGGSAADAQHLAAEIVGRFKLERRGLPAIALTTDSSILTAIGNDYGFDRIFSRQVEALASPGDILVGISTSGNSPNVLEAVRLASGIGCRTIGFLGRDGGALAAACDRALIVPTSDTPRIQEAHITLIHILCDLIERRLFAEPAAAH